MEIDGHDDVDEVVVDAKCAWLVRGFEFENDALGVENFECVEDELRVESDLDLAAFEMFYLDIDFCFAGLGSPA